MRDCVSQGFLKKLKFKYIKNVGHIGNEFLPPKQAKAFVSRGKSRLILLWL
jgi:hypothetical protein